MAGNMSGSPLLTLDNVSWNSRTNTTFFHGDMAHIGSLTVLNVTGETVDEDDSGREFYLLAQLVTGLFFYPIVCLFGLTGNILSIIVLSGRQMATSTNSFLVGLAVADTIKLLNDAIYSVVTLVIYLNPPVGHRALGYMYPYAHYLFNASVCITAWLSVAVAAERYMLVCHATRARTLCNISRARTTVVFVFVSMSLLTLPFALRYRTVLIYQDDTNATSVDVDVTELWRVRGFVVAYTWSQNCMRSLVPIAILCALSYFIVRSLRRTQQSTKRRLSSRRRITVMLVSVIVVFVLCVTPDAVISTVYGFGYYEANYVVRGVREITDLLLTVNSAVNFILYCTFNRIFRKNFLALFCRQTRQRTSLSGPTLKLSFGHFRQSTLPNGVNNDA